MIRRYETAGYEDTATQNYSEPVLYPDAELQSCSAADVGKAHRTGFNRVQTKI